MDVFIKKFIVDIVDDIITIWLTGFFTLVTVIMFAIHTASTVLLIMSLISSLAFIATILSAFKTIKRYRSDLNLQREMETHVRKKKTVQAKN